MDDESKAMKAVLEGMGAAARRAKARKYEPKLKAPVAEPEAAPAEAGEPSLADLDAMLSQG